MKTTLSLLCFLVFIASSSFTTLTQPTASNNLIAKKAVQGFSFFRTHRQGHAGIMCTWGVDSESGVSAYVVERTYEDPTDPYAMWETVALVPASGARSYKALNSNVFPGFISYRVKIQLNNGQVTSWINTIHIVSH
jgi:hypothetical protein